MQAALEDLRKRRLTRRDRLVLWWRARRRLSDATDGLVPRCDACADHCCKAPHEVSLRLEDVARLREAGYDAAIVSPPAGRLAIYREPTLAKNPDGTCVFFGADGRCAIYALRPLVCRRFPYFIAADGRTLRYAGSCRSRAEGDAATRRALTTAAVESHAARFSDLLLVRRARAALAALGLVAPSAHDRFDAALRASRRG